MAPTAATFETLLLNLDKQLIKAKEHNIPEIPLTSLSDVP